jgi:tRNA threonylcarbamoyladenosine biosynthesis protein TsaB
MKILAIETTGARAEIAVVDAGEVAAAVVFRHRMDLAQHLMPRIDMALQMAGLSLGDLGGIAVSLGPGSFTGIRIGVVTAKALAFAGGIPLAGVPTLAAVAAAEIAPPEALLCAVIPAREEELYAALYQRVDGELITRAAPMVVSVDELAERLARYPGPIFLAGDAPEAAARLTASLGARALTRRELPPLIAPWLASLARARLAEGGDDPATLAPLYVRAAAVTLKNATGQREVKPAQ